MRFYSGNRAPFVYVLFSEKDADRVQSVVHAMEGGPAFAPLSARPQMRIAARACAVLAFLSEGFAEQPALVDAFFAVKDAGIPVVPVRLDGAALPETMEQALYARNSILAEKYDTPEELAERIQTAPALEAPAVTAAQKKAARWTTGIAAGIAAAAMVLGVVLLVSGLRKPEEQVEIQDQVNQYGLTQADLEEITGVYIAGDEIKFFRGELEANMDWFDPETDMIDPEDASELGTVYLDYSLFSSSSETGRWTNWYWDSWNAYAGTNGHWPEGIIGLPGDFGRPLTRQDLSILPMLPNLVTVDLIRVEADRLPDLSGLPNLENVILRGCRIPDLSGLAGSPVRRVEFSMARGTDLSVLTGCTQLEKVYLDACGMVPDFHGFAPPALKDLDITWSSGFYIGEEDYETSSAMKPSNVLDWMYNAQYWDMTPLSQVTGLRSLRIKQAPMLALEFLRGMENLEELYVVDWTLVDVSGIGALHDLRSLQIDATKVADFSSIGQCRKLETLAIRGGSARGLAFLAGLTNLTDLELHGFDAPNLDFLSSLPDNGALSLIIDNVIQDLSGLEAISHYKNLAIILSSINNKQDPLIYLHDAKVDGRLSICYGEDLDLSMLPQVGRELQLSSCDIRDLTPLRDLGWQCPQFRIFDAPHLESLDGLESWDSLESVRVSDCVRLKDCSALEKLQLRILELQAVPDVPCFRDMSVTEKLSLGNIFLLTDLGALEELRSQPKKVNIWGMPQIIDQQPLKNLRGGVLYTNPSLERFAAMMVGSGNFDSYTVGGSDEQAGLQLQLEQLSDLELFPDSVLSQVRSLYITGDRIYDPAEFYSSWEWQGRKKVLTLNASGSNENEDFGPGIIESLSQLSRLTGLEMLELHAQPITSLDGIEALTNLRSLNVGFNDKLTDVSAAFLLDRLESLELDNSPVTSVQGIQNLNRLQHLSVSETKIADLAPLAQGDYSYAQENGAYFTLSESGSTDPAFLSGVPHFRYLFLENMKMDAGEVFRQMAGCQVNSLTVSDLKNNEELVALAQNLVGVERLELRNCQGITDLTPLLQMKGLQTVSLAHMSAAAYRSLEGQTIPFSIQAW